jgi:ferrochelatase
MKRDGVRRVLTYVTSGFSCYSGCRQYRENIAAALEQPEAAGMQIDKLRVFYNHADFIAVLAEQVGSALEKFPGEVRDAVHVAFTAHSIPLSMSTTSDYEKQLREACRLVAERLEIPESRWKLVYQSRSGRPQDPWLEPDILDHLREAKASGINQVLISPIGFLSDHMEVLYDLDDEARRFCDEHAIQMVRASTPGNHPQFVRMIRKLIQERMHGAKRECLGEFPANHDVCPLDCCPAPISGRPAAGRPPAAIPST